ncbi:carboxypeptidase-like regulatory domain-containing protein [Aquabacterium humicola]|uniref:carboxypeptidase-like regulatory domain-containing protein n=1 Tax=Aquabacterium humicola TaxID=3237377 RepID=UPI002543861A|nr:carboxypeptidase-like regulatory domain-containing protein [Rubrivivax pictus]
MATEPASDSNRAGEPGRRCGSRSGVGSVVRPGVRLLALAAIAALLCGTWPLPVAAQTTLRGQVTDRTTGQGVIGAQIELRRGATVLQTAASGDQGRWQMSVDVGGGAQAQNFKLVVTNRLYAEATPDVVVASGAALQPVIDVALVRLSVADCLPRLARPRRVVVTHFLPPAQADGAGSFAERVAGTLRQQLVFLERSGLADALQHTVVACAQIDDSENLAALARELKADALMGGQIAQTPPPPAARYTVTMRLRDAHGCSTRRSRSAAPASTWTTRRSRGWRPMRWRASCRASSPAT